MIRLAIAERAGFRDMQKGYGSRGGYDRHTAWSQQIPLQADLRRCWDLLAMVRGMLASIESSGGLAQAAIYPGEHYRLCRLALDTCARARVLVTKLEMAKAEFEADREARLKYFDSNEANSREWTLPKLHEQAMGAIRELGAFESFRTVAIDKSIFDRVSKKPDLDPSPSIGE